MCSFAHTYVNIHAYGIVSYSMIHTYSLHQQFCTYSYQRCTPAIQKYTSIQKSCIYTQCYKSYYTVPHKSINQTNRTTLIHKCTDYIMQMVANTQNIIVLQLHTLHYTALPFLQHTLICTCIRNVICIYMYIYIRNSMRACVSIYIFPLVTINCCGREPVGLT